MRYDSDIWQTVSVSGLDVQTRDFSIAVYNGNKYDVMGLGKFLSLGYLKSPDHADWWNVWGTDRSYLPYDSDIWRTTSVSAAVDANRQLAVLYAKGDRSESSAPTVCLSLFNAGCF